MCVRTHALTRALFYVCAPKHKKSLFLSPSLTPPHAHTPQPTVSHLVLQVDVGAGGEQRCHHLHVAVVGGEVEGGVPVLQAAGRP